MELEEYKDMIIHLHNDTEDCRSMADAVYGYFEKQGRDYWPEITSSAFDLTYEVTGRHLCNEEFDGAVLNAAAAQSYDGALMQVAKILGLEHNGLRSAISELNELHQREKIDFPICFETLKKKSDHWTECDRRMEEARQLAKRQQDR